MNSAGPSVVPPQRVGAVRAFNRFYTGLIGVLSEGLLETPYSLTEARVIFELAQRDVSEVAVLRGSLGLAAGYLSRILSRFANDGLIRRERSADDARRQVAGLTEKGRTVYADLDARSGEQIGRILSGLAEADQRRLVGAMATVEGLLGERRRPDMYVLRAFEPGDFGWVVQRHGALYAAEYGWDATFEALVARVVADYVENRGPRGDAWIAEVGGKPTNKKNNKPENKHNTQHQQQHNKPKAHGMGIG